LTVLILLLACAASTSSPPSTPEATTAPAPAPKAAWRTIDLSTFKAEYYAGKVPLVVDVRTPKEYAEGHVPGAQSIPLDQLPSRMAELSSHKDAPIYLICESGGRSARASDLLTAAGYQAVNIDGGTYAWREAGLPTEK
jgi:rhodanese-related sulfurtransferase